MSKLVILVTICAALYLATPWGQNTTQKLRTQLNVETPIGDIVSAPLRFHGKEVVVRGVVGDGFGIVGYGLYELTDNTGGIMIATSRGIPPKGKVVSRLTGNVHQSFSFRGKTKLVIKQSEKEDDEQN